MSIPSLLNTDSAEYFRSALSSIDSEQQRLWGTLGPSELMAHLRRSIEISLEEYPETKMIPMPFPRWCCYLLFFRIWTNWPKSKIKAPRSFLPKADRAQLEVERQHLFEVLERFISQLAEEPSRRTLSPLLGRISLARWSRVHAVHFRHHLRQFGQIS